MFTDDGQGISRIFLSDIIPPGVDLRINIPSTRRYMGVSKNKGTPKSSILIGFSLINHPFWGTPIFGNIHIVT